MIQPYTHYNASMENPDVSIVIVSWNAKKFLKQCLRSVYDTIREITFEVWVADNNSSDGSPEMVRKKFPQTKLICTGDNLGFAKANNICIKKSRGRYLCLINSDVKLVNDSIEVMLSYIDKHPEVGMLGPKVINPDKTLQQSVRNFPTYWNAFSGALALDTIFPKSQLFGNCPTPLLANDSPRNVDVLLGCFWMVRREALNDVGLLDERFFMYREDVDWCKRFKLAGWKVVYFPKVEAIHYGGGSSSNAPIECYVEMKRSSLLFWKKFHGRFGILYISIITFLHEIIRIVRGIILYVIKPSERRKFGYRIKRSMACISWLLGISGRKQNDIKRVSGM